jgi:hypothetical protein
MEKTTYLFRYTDLLFVVEATSYDEALAKAMTLEGSTTTEAAWELVRTFKLWSKQKNY